MIKKVLLIVLALSLISASALAAGKLTVIQEHMIASDSYGSVEVKVFAEVENTGDRPVEYSAGTVEIFDADGNTVAATNRVYCYPYVLAPGEKGYAFNTLYPENISAAEIADYSLNVMGISSTKEAKLLPVTATFEIVQEGNWKYYYMVAEITNETSDIVYYPYCVFALKDADGQLLYVDYTSYSAIGIPPGNTIIIRYSVPDNIITYYADHGLVPSTADAIAFQY
ncbi:MAG: hypothetical protein JW811_07260 [Clostridiales bacterium]|nr:hypothetical protein [Clostridiales bacterium]